MGLFRRTPVTVEAFQLGLDPMPYWFTCSNKVNIEEDWSRNEAYIKACYVKTLEGITTAYAGDYIIRGVEGDLSVCRVGTFRKMYEEVD